MVSAIISELQMEIATMYEAQSTSKRFKESNIIHTTIKILALLKIRELDVIAEHRRVNKAQPVHCGLVKVPCINTDSRAQSAELPLLLLSKWRSVTQGQDSIKLLL